MTKPSDPSYREAERRIAEARRKRSNELKLDNWELPHPLTEIPQSLAQLTELRSLKLAGNALTTLPESLRQLPKLNSLNLSGNRLTSLPSWFTELDQLRSLQLGDNQLTALSESIRQLVLLESLELNQNKLTQLPEWIADLKMLRILKLDQNRFMSLPQSIGELVQLRVLALHNNRLQTLPESILKLKELENLYLSNNPLESLPANIGQLRNLRSLTMAGTKIRSLPNSMSGLAALRFLASGDTPITLLPEWVGQLKALQGLEISNNGTVVYEWEESRRFWESADLSKKPKHSGLAHLPQSLMNLPRLRELYLHGNKQLKLPAEILGSDWDNRTSPRPADPQAILAFYFGQRKQNAKPLNEVKLLLVGHGRVGKTSLSKALRRIAHDKREPETPGIERHPLPLTVGRSKITAHIWDFGGQEFLHQTHQFFFSERSVYVVVLSGRQGRPMQEAEYWLRLIRTYGTGSPVVIALNQIKSHPFTVDEHFLQENYPEVKAVVRTDCDPRRGIEALRKLLGTLAGRMPSVRERIDPAWARVRARLENMQESFVSFDQYRRICSEEGVETAEKQDTLATILDCLGIALNYRNDPRLRDTSVLKPRWLVDGIYTILRWLHKHETNGEMRLKDFPKALKSKRSYPPDMYKFLLALMEKFELCFPIAEKKGVYLVPGLLDENQPLEFKKFMVPAARRIQFRYEDVRPPGLLPRFIVRSHTLSERQVRWLRGVVLARGKARALVRGDHEGRVTDVFAMGDDNEDRVWLTEFILAEMRVLNEKLPVQTFIESESKPGAWSELEVLRDAVTRDQKMRSERAPDGGTVLIDVAQTLREIETPEANAPREKPVPLFICYSHANERAVRQLIPSLKVLARRGYVSPWRDTDLVPGEDWDDTIKDRLMKARVIMFMVSREFLASDYITQHERPLAMSLMSKKKALVVPVILLPCTCDEEDFARLENLPRKGSPVSSFNPRAEAWKLVEEGLKKAVEQMRKSTRFRSVA